MQKNRIRKVPVCIDSGGKVDRFSACRNKSAVQSPKKMPLLLSGLSPNRLRTSEWQMSRVMQARAAISESEIGVFAVYL